MNPKKENIAFFSSIFVMLSPPVLYSLWMMVEAELFGVVFLFTSLILFVELKKFEEVSRKSIFYLLLFMAFSSFTVLTKETVRVFLFVLISVFSYFWFEKKISKIQKVAVFFLLFVTMLSFYPTLVSPGLGGFKTGIGADFNHLEIIFLQLFSNSNQIIYSVFLSGLLWLFIYALFLWFEKMRLVNYKRLVFLIGGILLVLMTTTPPLHLFSFYNLIIFSDSYIMPIFGIVLFISLLLVFLYGNKTLRVCSASILLVFATVLFVVLFIPSTRSDVASRVYVTASPFLFYLIFSSFNAIRYKIGELKGRILKGGVFFIILMIPAVTFAFYFSASLVNGFSEFDSRSHAEFEAKRFLKDVDLTGSLIFATNKYYPVGYADLDLLFSKKDFDANFSRTLREIHLGGVEHVKNHICMENPARYKNVYIYSLKNRASGSGYQETIYNKFNLSEQIFYYILWKRKPPEREYSEIDIHFLTVYRNETDLEQYIREVNGTLLFEYKKHFFTISPWLEDTLSRLINKIPLISKHEYISTVYKIDVASLSCGRKHRQSEGNHTN
jgi:hypothetical protein